MLRKFGLVAVAAASLGAAALAPTAASAWGGHGWHRGWGMAVTGAVPASSSVARPTVTAAATCGDWSRPPGARAGA